MQSEVLLAVLEGRDLPRPEIISTLIGVAANATRKLQTAESRLAEVEAQRDEWHDRCDEADAACAAMREALIDIDDVETGSGWVRDRAHRAYSSTDAGRALLTELRALRERVPKLERVLDTADDLRLHEPCGHRVSFVAKCGRCVAERRLLDAIDAAKGEAGT